MKKKFYKKIQIKGKRRKLHRVIMERYLGRSLSPTEVVHHIDGNKHNNNIENLKLISVEEHVSLHHAGKSHKRVYRRPHNKLSYQRIKTIIKYYHQGITPCQIARKMGLADVTIRKYILQEGIPPV